VFTEAKDDGGGGDYWSYKSCKAPVKSSPPTNQNPAFLQAGCPSCHPTNSVKALKGIGRDNLSKGKGKVCNTPLEFRRDAHLPS